MSMLEAQLDTVRGMMPFRVVGCVQGVTGLTIEASDLPLSLGSLCRIHSFGGQTTVAEVIGMKNGKTLLMALSAMIGVARGDRVENLAASPRIWCSEALLGRVLNGYGQPVDGKGPIRSGKSLRIDRRGLPALERRAIDSAIGTGVRAIDALHTCGLGQRMAILSGPGVGKSTLISGVARHTSADVSVVALIGERGREVKDFLSHALGEEGLRKSVVIVSTSDDPPLLRVRAAKVACTVSEYFREQGKDVLLLMDSLTRLCQAQRQIGLSAQEPPATRGYPPSVFALLPEILERAGRAEHGSVTGFYTVLVEGDEMSEPIADAVKGITDGHLILARNLASRGHFPAIDVLESVSRVRTDVTPVEQQKAVRKILALYHAFKEVEDLVNIGAYVPGASVEIDLAVQARPKIVQFLQQDPRTAFTLEQSTKQVMELSAWIDQLERALKVQATRPANRAAVAAIA